MILWLHVPFIQEAHYLFHTYAITAFTHASHLVTTLSYNESIIQQSPNLRKKVLQKKIQKLKKKKTVLKKYSFGKKHVLSKVYAQTIKPIIDLNQHVGLNLIVKPMCRLNRQVLTCGLHAVYRSQFFCSTRLR